MRFLILLILGEIHLRIRLGYGNLFIFIVLFGLRFLGNPLLGNCRILWRFGRLIRCIFWPVGIVAFRTGSMKCI